MTDDLVYDRDQRIEFLAGFELRFRQPVHALRQPVHARGQSLQLVLKHDLRSQQTPVLILKFDMPVDKNFNQTLQAIQPARVMPVRGHSSFYLADA
jgi:hypothetical protein